MVQELRRHRQRIEKKEDFEYVPYRQRQKGVVEREKGDEIKEKGQRKRKTK